MRRARFPRTFRFSGLCPAAALPEAARPRRRGSRRRPCLRRGCRAGAGPVRRGAGDVRGGAGPLFARRRGPAGPRMSASFRRQMTREAGGGGLPAAASPCSRGRAFGVHASRCPLPAWGARSGVGCGVGSRRHTDSPRGVSGGAPQPLHTALVESLIEGAWLFFLFFFKLTSRDAICYLAA